MTRQEKELLKPGMMFSSINGYEYRVLGFNSHKDDPEKDSFISLERLDDKSTRTIHYSKQPFYQIITSTTATPVGVAEQKGNPHGNSRTIF